MKGIKKLFFGLIFMTLVGVGFKVDVNAHSLKLKEPSSWADEGFNIDILKITKADIDNIIGDPEGGDYELNCNIALVDKYNNLIDIVEDDILIKLTHDELGYDVDSEDERVYNITGNEKNGFNVYIATNKNDEIYGVLSGSGDYKEGLFRAFTGDYDESTGAQNKKSDKISVKAYKYTTSATLNKKTTRRDQVVFTPSTGYLLNGDQETVGIESNLEGATIQSITNADYIDEESCLVTGGKKVVNVVVDYGIGEDYLSIPLLEADGCKIGLGYYSKPFDYTYDGDIDDIKSVELGGKRVLYEFDDSDGFRFQASNGVGTGTKTLRITFKNGSYKEFKNIQVIDVSKVSFKIESKITTYEGYTRTVTPTVGGAKTDGFILDYDSTDFVAKSNTKSIEISGINVNDSPGDPMVVIPDIDVDVYSKTTDGYSEEQFFVKHNLIRTVYVKVDVPQPVTTNDVYVIEGFSIGLSKFVSGSKSSSMPVSVDLDNDADELIDVNPTDGSISDIKIKGKKQGSKSEAILVTPAKDESKWKKVTVYRKPSLSLDSSSSSSSSSSYSNASYKFTVKMPYGDYHDDWTVSSLGTVEFTVISSSGDEKTLKKISLSSSSSSEGSKSASTTITAREIADALGKSSDSVKIRAYAYDGSRDDKVYAEYSLSYNTGSSSSSSSSSSTSGKGGSGGSGSEYDDVPKTGESKTDIWVLWTVLFIAILGAGFMIWKRFGLVRAIAEAEEEYEAAEQEERVEAARKEKEDKINMIKDLRNL